MKKTKTVEEYIKNSPEDVRERLREFRKLILSIMPKGTEEKISYSMPFYGYNGPVAYFASQKNYIGLYIPPPIIPDNAEVLKNYVTTKSAIHFPNDEKIPVQLIKKLIKARLKYNEK